MNLIDAAKQALGELNGCAGHHWAYKALAEAIAQAEKAEPVARIEITKCKHTGEVDSWRFVGRPSKATDGVCDVYTVPPAAQPEPSCEDAKLAEAIMSECGRSTEDTRLLERITNRLACLRPPAAQPISRNQVREIYMRHGFVIKDGLDDLKEYVYSAADEIVKVALSAHRKPLTAKEVDECWRGLMPSGHGKSIYDIARAIEARHGIGDKNESN